MKPLGVVVDTPAFDQDLGLLEGVEDFTVQKLVPQPAVEALDVAVLPWAAGFDVERLHAQPPKPRANSLGHEFRAIVGADVLRWPEAREQTGQGMKDILRIQPALNADSETVAGVLIENGQHTVSPSIMGPVMNEVVGPDMIAVRRPEPNA